MKRLILIVAVFLLGSAGLAQAFLNDNDPEHFFELAQRAPLVVSGKVEGIEVPLGAKKYFIYRISLSEVLGGSSPKKEFKIFQEQIFPKDAPAMNLGQEVLLFLAPMPNYTAYQTATRAGVQYRLFGAARGAWEVASNPELMEIVKEILAKGDSKAILFKMLKSKNSEILSSGAHSLAGSNFPKGAFGQEEEAFLYSLIAGEALSKSAKLDLIRALKGTESVDTLKKIVLNLQGSAKWAAVRALEELGIQRKTGELVGDFNRGDLETKKRAVALLAKRGDPKAREFFRQVLRGGEDYNVKRTAIMKMGEAGGKVNEEVLMENLSNSEELVSAQAILALGKMNSHQSVPEIIKILNSPSKVLRDAAILSLYVNQDPHAMRYFQENFVKDAHGHLQPKGHFSDVPGAGPPHSHSSSGPLHSH